ncbi:MAG: PIN domain-containing protein [Acidimicrobiia bacterium]|nr:PIN domain-containing protein [Acidimicrobiia bacterium]
MTVRAVDTSVVVPALLASHTEHERCRVAAAGCSVPAHVLVEAYSVLTRLPSPHRLRPEVADTLLARWFPADKVLVVPAALQRAVPARLRASGVSAGAVFDGLVALTAAAHDRQLLTRDIRALRTYEAIGVSYRVLEP